MKDTKTGRTRAQFLLLKALADEGREFVTGHLWVNERDRWKELVFALLTRTCALPQRRIREAVDRLDLLGLIEVANFVRPDAKAYSNPRLVETKELLAESGFTSPEVERALQVMIEAAQGLDQHYHGKIQCYLRKCGELILREATD